MVTTNEGTEDVHVSRIWLRADHFVALSPDEKTTTLRPGGKVAIKTSFGQVTDCDEVDRLAVEVVLEATVGTDGERRFYRWDDLPTEVPDAIRESECEEQLIARSVTVSISDEWESDGEIVEAVMVFERSESGETVTIADILGLVLFGAHAIEDRDPVGILEPDDDLLEVPIRVHLARCDEHALSQLPDGIVFRAFISVADRPSHSVKVHPPSSLEAELWEIVDRCTG